MRGDGVKVIMQEDSRKKINTNIRRYLGIKIDESESILQRQ